MMKINPFTANRELYETINNPVPNPPGSKGLTLIPVRKKTPGDKSRIITPAQILFVLFLPEILKARKFVIHNASMMISRNTSSITSPQFFVVLVGRDFYSPPLV